MLLGGNNSMNVKYLIDLFIKVADFYDDSYELHGQEGDIEISEQYGIQRKVVLEMIEYLKTCNNTSIFLPVVLKQLIQKYPAFDVVYFKLFLQNSIDGIDFNIHKMEEDKNQFTNIKSLIEDNKDFLSL